MKRYFIDNVFTISLVCRFSLGIPLHKVTKDKCNFFPKSYKLKKTSNVKFENK